MQASRKLPQTIASTVHMSSKDRAGRLEEEEPLPLAGRRRVQPGPDAARARVRVAAHGGWRGLAWHPRSWQALTAVRAARR
jgi:hypothetical protein